jgi:adenylate cyclase
MAQDKFKRKLTTIFSADVAGYSRLMGEDEAATVRTLDQYKEVMSELIRQHRGRVVDSPGDNLLAEFTSVVDGVQCAVAAQNEFKARNAELPENRKMQFRIGINLGDVIQEESRIYGDGVNIAARLESLADPGGICVSKTAFDHIETKLPLGYEFLGEQEVKNIAKPVGAYRVLMEPRVTVAGAKATKIPLWRHKTVLASAIVVLVAIIGVGVWSFYLRAPTIEPASREKMALPLPDLPSIAVLPFANLSEDPKQGLLCDAITDNIINALSKLPRLFVIARNSTFTYKGKAVKVKQVSEELGVRYVLEGSLQRSGDRVRITLQLVDALTGNQLLAEHYDGETTDLFDLQDDIAIKILNAIRVKLVGGEGRWLYAKYFRGKQGLDCYSKLLEGAGYVQRMTVESTELTRQLVEDALTICPENPLTYRLMAAVHTSSYWLGSAKSPRESIEKSIELMQKVLAMDDDNAEAHGYLSHLYTITREYDKAIAEGERGMALDPGGAWAVLWYATALMFAGRPEEAIPLFEKAIRLNPFGPTMFFHQFGHALRDTGRLDEAVSAYKKGLERAPNYILTHASLAATYSMMGRDKEAQAEAAEVLRINPKFSLEWLAKTSAYKDRSVTEKLINAMRKAGLPDKPPPAQP